MSTNVAQMLKRIIELIRVHMGWDDVVQDDQGNALERFRCLIRAVDGGKRVILVIDGADQLEHIGALSPQVDWLPAKLPANVRVIISCASTDDAASRAGHHGTLDALRGREHVLVTVPDLTDAERLGIVSSMPSLSAKKLDRMQVRALLANPGTRNPLFLSVALEELRGFGVFERLRARIEALPCDGNLVSGLFSQVISRLEQEFDITQVKHILSYLACSRHGLRERELQDLLEDGPDTGSTHDLYPVLRQIRPYLLHCGGSLDLYHRSLREAVQERYFTESAETRRVHGLLAKYFLDGLHVESRGGSADARERALCEAPYHLAAAGDWLALLALVLDARVGLVSRWVDGIRGEDGIFCLTLLINALASRRGQLATRAGLATQLARIYSTLGQVEPSRRWLQEVALPATSWRHGRRVRAIALHELGSLDLYTGKVGAAARNYRRALWLCRLGGARLYDERAANLVALATIAYGAFRYRQSLWLARSALRWSRRSADTAHEAASLRILAIASREMERFGDAEVYCAQGLALACEHGLRLERASLQLVLARIVFARGFLEGSPNSDARSALYLALEFAKEAQNAYSILDAKLELGWLAVESCDVAEAHDWFSQVFKGLAMGQYDELRGPTETGRAIVAATHLDANHAVTNLETAIEFCKNQSLFRDQARGLVALGALYSRLGDERATSRAWDGAMKAARMVSQLCDTMTRRAIKSLSE